MMKKYKSITAMAMAAAVAAGGLAGCGASGKDIGQEEAKKIAFEDAGVSESDTSRLRVEKDRDDGMIQYEVQFNAAEKEYSYDIDGSSGEILSSDVETDSTAAGDNAASGQSGTDNSGNTGGNASGDTAGNTSGTANADVTVSEEDAKKAALDRVPGATDADIRMELELDDGFYIYEGDIIYDQKEYEFEINAQNGNFLKWSEERY